MQLQPQYHQPSMWPMQDGYGNVVYASYDPATGNMVQWMPQGDPNQQQHPPQQQPQAWMPPQQQGPPPSPSADPSTNPGASMVMSAQGQQEHHHDPNATAYNEHMAILGHMHAQQQQQIIQMRHLQHQQRNHNNNRYNNNNHTPALQAKKASDESDSSAESSVGVQEQGLNPVDEHKSADSIDGNDKDASKKEGGNKNMPAAPRRERVRSMSAEPHRNQPQQHAGQPQQHQGSFPNRGYSNQQRPRPPINNNNNNNNNNSGVSMNSMGNMHKIIGTEHFPPTQEDLPIRPDSTDCAFYLQHGRCAYGYLCRYNHPPEVAKAQQPAAYNSIGLPLRPGKPSCAFFMRTNACKFGATCKFNHPDLSNDDPHPHQHHSQQPLRPHHTHPHHQPHAQAYHQAALQHASMLPHQQQQQHPGFHGMPMNGSMPPGSPGGGLMNMDSMGHALMQPGGPASYNSPAEHSQETMMMMHHQSMMLSQPPPPPHQPNGPPTLTLDAGKGKEVEVVSVKPSAETETTVDADADVVPEPEAPIGTDTSPAKVATVAA